MSKMISLHDVLEPLKQALLASRDMIISSQICGSNLQKVFYIRWRMLAPHNSFAPRGVLSTYYALEPPELIPCAQFLFCEEYGQVLDTILKPMLFREERQNIYHQTSTRSFTFQEFRIGIASPKTSASAFAAENTLRKLSPPCCFAGTRPCLSQRTYTRHPWFWGGTRFQFPTSRICHWTAMHVTRSLVAITLCGVLRCRTADFSHVGSPHGAT